MRRLVRPGLSADALAHLASCAAQVAAAQRPKEEAAAAWASRTSNQAFEEIERVLRGAAPGNDRCMYCEDSEGSAIEHFYPKSAYPERAFDWSNYLWACEHCNSNYKRAQFPLDPQSNEPLLLDPMHRSDDPKAHLELLEGGQYLARTPRGATSIEVYGLCRNALCRQRGDAWVGLQLLVECWAQHVDRGASRAEIDDAKQRVLRHSHASALLWLFRRAASERLALSLRPAFQRVWKRHGATLARWVEGW